MTLSLNQYHTIAISILILMLGEFLRNRIFLLKKYCIPVPVVGGLLFTILLLIGYETNSFHVKLNMVFKDLFMLLFYAGIGFTASWKLLKKGGPQVIVFLILSSILVVFQNLLGVILGNLLGVGSLVGIATASIPMTGGHGTSAAFAPVLESVGLEAATTISLAAATFGLVAGSLIGGPTGHYLIEKYHLNSSEAGKIDLDKIDDKDIIKESRERSLIVGTYQLLLTVGFGCIISDLLTKTGLAFPASVGGMTAALIVRNWADNTSCFKLRLKEISIISNVSLLIFLALSMMTLKLWQLTSLAVPMLILLFAQTGMMFLFAVFVTFRFMGKNYDAAMIAVGHCGFGLGAVPTAMANMQSVESKYGPSPRAYFIVPLVGSLFINIVNSFIITIFINYCK
ncbi:sodium/glutamate symporter [Acidaminococcus massiliensis]|jgi:ESS family glutamate:Na+ symporter|uniref:sodium/glutamate symporter n=1 Tax=Acidaminococcus massiliensis TaxID=1852375 RepID=UPI0023F44C79|nr:sodium/glutamate symporter [Acidaminococcus massiliensis]